MGKLYSPGKFVFYVDNKSIRLFNNRWRNFYKTSTVEMRVKILESSWTHKSQNRDTWLERNHF